MTAPKCKARFFIADKEILFLRGSATLCRRRTATFKPTVWAHIVLEHDTFYRVKRDIFTAPMGAGTYRRQSGGDLYPFL